VKALREDTNMAGLSKETCTPCRGGEQPLKGEALEPLAAQTPEWKIVDGRHLERTFKFPDFAAALAFVNRVGELAEQEGHHPDVHLSWGRVGIELQTHKIGGLSINDFILAAKIDRLPAD
jgi:4a-hydroxytetrahydrobiopterin dehydratase